MVLAAADEEVNTKRFTFGIAAAAFKAAKVQSMAGVMTSWGFEDLPTGDATCTIPSQSIPVSVRKRLQFENGHCLTIGCCLESFNIVELRDLEELELAIAVFLVEHRGHPAVLLLVANRAADSVAIGEELIGDVAACSEEVI